MSLDLGEINRIEALSLRQFFDEEIFLEIHSNLLSENIAFASTTKVALAHSGEGLTIYTANEITKLLKMGVGEGDLIAIHKTKKAFGSIAEIKSEIKS